MNKYQKYPMLSIGNFQKGAISTAIKALQAHCEKHNEEFVEPLYGEATDWDRIDPFGNHPNKYVPYDTYKAICLRQKDPKWVYDLGTKLDMLWTDRGAAWMEKFIDEKITNGGIVTSAKYERMLTRVKTFAEYKRQAIDSVIEANIHQAVVLLNNSSTTSKPVQYLLDRFDTIYWIIFLKGGDVCVSRNIEEYNRVKAEVKTEIAEEGEFDDNEYILQYEEDLNYEFWYYFHYSRWYDLPKLPIVRRSIDNCRQADVDIIGGEKYIYPDDYSRSHMISWSHCNYVKRANRNQHSYMNADDILETVLAYNEMIRKYPEMYIKTNAHFCDCCGHPVLDHEEECFNCGIYNPHYIPDINPNWYSADTDPDDQEDFADDVYYNYIK